MIAVDPHRLDLSDSWQDGDPSARWRSAVAYERSDGAAGSGSSLLELEPGCRLPRHTDSAEEIVVVLAGHAAVTVGEERSQLSAGGLAVVPKCVPHEVRNAGVQTLRFLAIYAEPEVVTTYEAPVQPDGGASRQTVS